MGIGPYGGYKGCNGRATARVAPTKGLQGVRWFLWCVGEGLCPSRGRGNRRSAASGGCSEAISRKCPDWRPQQWPGIGRYDGGQENPAPMKLQGVRCKSGRVVREADPYGGVTRRAVQIKGGPAGRPYGFYIHFLYLISTFYMRFAENQSPRGRGLPV